MNGPSREVFGNVQPWMQGLFYIMIAASIGVAAWRLWGRVQLWRQGNPGDYERDWRVWFRRLSEYALLQKRVVRASLGGVLHLMLFSGFLVLTIGTTLLFISHAGPWKFHSGWYYLFYELAMDVFGAAFCVGCALALYRRLYRRSPSLGHDPRDWALLCLLLFIGLSGFLLEALRLKYSQVGPMEGRWSIVGWGIQSIMPSGLSVEGARIFHLTVWWLHAASIAVFFATLPVTRMLHAITGPLNIAVRPSRSMGALELLSLEAVEESGRIGVAAVRDFSRQQLLSLDACMECGWCEDACPAWASGKPLSPKAVVVDLRNLMSQAGAPVVLDDRAEVNGPSGSSSPHGALIHAETLWSCTMCQACVARCPVLVGHVDLIADMRRNLVGEGQLFGPPANALRALGSVFNPYGRSNAERANWAEGLDVPTVADNPNFEYLLWVGCAAAFDPRAQRIARATAQLLAHAGLNFAVLGTHERCTGDPARRLGDEFLFQQLAQSNITTLDKHRVRRIVALCPHCVNTLLNEYPQLGGRYEAVHHTQLLAQLIDEKRLAPAVVDSATFHDPCYLARVGGETIAPRKLIASASQEPSGFREMPRCGKETFCCGAGGGRMWFDEAPAQRPSHLRAQEAMDTGAKTLATACPYCLGMMSDAVAGVGHGEALRVMDVAELLIQGQPDRGG